MVSVKDGHGWFLTTGHVFGQYNAVWMDDAWHQVEVTHRWNNIALNEYLILIRTVQKLPPKNYIYFPLAEDQLSAGDQVNYIGFPSNRYVVRKARVIPFQNSILRTVPHPNPGISGGGIVKGGNLYGIIHGYETLTGIGHSHNLYPLILRMKQDAPGVFTTNRPELEAPAPLPVIPPPPEKAKPSWPTFPTPKKKDLEDLPVSAPSAKPEENSPEETKKGDSSEKESVSLASPTFLSSVREKASDPTLWLDLLTGAALIAGTGGTGFAAWKGTKYLSAGLRVWKGAKAVKANFPFSEPMLPRDDTELKQVLSLREQEKRVPVHDCYIGVAIEDEYRSNPNQTIKEAFEKATARFNSVAPLSDRATSSCTNNTGEEK